MAQSDQGSKGPAAGKRLARAKVKRPETEAEREMRKADRRKLIRNVAISVFAALLVFSMMIPYLASLVTNVRNARAVAAAQSSDAQITSEQIDESYAEGVEELEATLADDPDNLETLLELGNQYLSWGYVVGAYSTDEDAATHSTELLDKAIATFDHYLELEDSVDVRTDRALCLLYEGQVSAAQEALEAVVADDPSHASAWANLGMIYELTNPDAAALAYERAIAADPDNEAGAKSYAESRLEALQAAAEESEAGDASAADESADTTDGASGTSD